MAVEDAQFISELDSDNPKRADFIHEGDDHARLTKYVLEQTFVNADHAFDMTEIEQAITPVGAIIMFNSDEAPAGWGLCNGWTYNKVAGGTIVSPDLRGRFIMAADERDVEKDHGSIGGAPTITPTTSTAAAHTHTGTAATGGSKAATTSGSTALTAAQMPPHNHGGGNHTHPSTSENLVAATGTFSARILKIAGVDATGASGNIIATEGSGHGHSHTIPAVTGHTHAVAVSGGGAHSHSVTVALNPPRYSLTFIMKL